MVKNISFNFGQHFTGFIEGQVAQGRYGNASDVVRAGLRLLEGHETQLTILQSALIAGEESGQPEVFDFEEFLAKKARLASSSE